MRGLFSRRKDYRFDAIECQNPYEVPVEEWKALIATKPSLKWMLINSLPLYNQTDGIPSFEAYQQMVLERTLTYSKALNVKKVHLVMTDLQDDADRYVRFHRSDRSLEKSVQIQSR